MKLDQRGSAVLGEDACRRYLAREAAASGVGRVAVNGERSPYVIPVNFTVVDGGIVIRLGPGWAAFHLDGSAVTFEADQAEVTQRSGWSVVVEGVAHVVTYDDIGRLGANLPTPMVTLPGVRVFEIVPFKVSGRAVEPDLRDEPRDLAGRHSWRKEDASEQLRLTPDGARELASVLQSALRCQLEVSKHRRSRPADVMSLERRRLLEGLSAQLSGAGTA